MNGEVETVRENSQTLLHLHTTRKGKLGIVSSKSEQIENTSKKVIRHRQNILKDTFYQMTRWRSTRSSSRSHTANDYLSNNNHTSQLLKPMENTQVTSQTQNTIIHDTFSHFFSKKHKILNIGVSPFVIKRKGKFEKNGIGELASKIAQTKPLRMKDNSDCKKTQQRRLRLRHKKQEQIYKNQPSVQFFSQQEKFVPKGVSFSSRNSPLKNSIFCHYTAKRSKLGDHFHPWRDNQDRSASPLKLNGGPDYCLSDILE